MSLFDATHGKPNNAIVVWLIVCTAMVAAMMLIGAITRLTESGLSMVEWRPLIGALPPISTPEWERIFALYRETSEYRLENAGMTLDAFKTIFWWEYIHRLWGRLIGAAYGIPLIWFLLRGLVPQWLKPHLIMLFILGGLQGIIGWWMVKSGFVDRHDVSQYRLAVHLSVAFVILGYMVWLISDFLDHTTYQARAPIWLSRLLAGFVVLVFITLMSGGLVAGLGAGFDYNSWPLQAGALVPSGVFDTVPVWRTAFEDILTVQFNHRMLAYATVITAVAAYLGGRLAMGPDRRIRYLKALALAAVLQLALGVATLLSVVAIPLAVLHQAGGIFLFCCAVIAYRAHRT